MKASKKKMKILANVRLAAAEDAKSLDDIRQETIAIANKFKKTKKTGLLGKCKTFEEYLKRLGL